MAAQRALHPSAALSAAVEAAQAAGRILRHGLGAPILDARTKAHRHDPVTAFDVKADAAIAAVLLAAAPGLRIVSEEGIRPGAARYPAWVVDPLDGTNNYLRGVPEVAVSIALVDERGPIAGCVYDPFRDELFTAVLGRGAERNGTRLAVSSLATLDGAVLGVGFSTEPRRREVTLAQLPPFIDAVRALRIVGAAALDLAYVAAGRFDAAWYLSLCEWDVAAGQLLVDEAGGCVTDLRGEPLVAPERGVLASNGALHARLVPLVAPAPTS